MSEAAATELLTTIIINAFLPQWYNSTPRAIARARGFTIFLSSYRPSSFSIANIYAQGLTELRDGCKRNGKNKEKLLDREIARENNISEKKRTRLRKIRRINTENKTGRQDRCNHVFFSEERGGRTENEVQFSATWISLPYACVRAIKAFEYREQRKHQAEKK